MKFVLKVLALLGITWGIHILSSVTMYLGLLFVVWWSAGGILAIVDSIIIVKYMKNEKENCEKDDIPVALAYIVFIIVWSFGNLGMYLLAPIYGMTVSGDPGYGVVMLACMAIGVIPILTLIVAKIVLVVRDKIIKK